MKAIVIYLFLGLLLSCQLLHGQVLDSLVAKLNKQLESHPSEMIYLQIGKDIYETGEDLWFKAYQLDASAFTLSALSRSLYLQVISEADSSIVWQEKYPIENGIADGHVYLDKKLKEGIYSLEAYTSNSFRRDDNGLFTVRKIKIQENISDTKYHPHEQIVVSENFRFETYPEGGSLIAGVSSRLAFKATDGRGNPVDVSGVLYEDDTPIVDIVSCHDGMGVLRFTPLAGKDYYVKLSNGKDYPLPTIYPQGLSLQLTGQNKEFVEFMVSRSKGLPAQTVYLLGQLRGVPTCGAKLSLLDDSIKIKMPLNEFFGQGIAEFTLFDKSMQPVAERVVYVHPEKKLYITAKFDKSTYMVKNKAKLNIKVTDESGRPVVTHLGVSIFDKAYADASYPVNMETHCLLSSQIRGKIHHPSYYFDVKNKNRFKALDLLLMTQGWRCYVWKFDEKQIEEKANEDINKLAGISDAVRGTQTIKKKQIKGIQQLIQVSNAEGNSLFVWTDSLGNFSVETDVLKGLRGGYIYLKPMLTKDNGPKLQMEDPFVKINEIRKEKERYYPFVDTSRVKHEVVDREPLINQFGTVLLNEVIVTTKKHKPFRDKFMGSLDSLAQMDLGPWVCEHGYLENYRDGYTHHHNPDYYPAPEHNEKRYAPIEGKKYHLLKPKYYPCNKGKGWCFTVEDQQEIIYEAPFYSDEELLERNNLWRTKGYYVAREFYHPDDLEMLSSMSDVRNTLFWSPTVITDTNGDATVTFWCSDLNTRFIGRIEGTDGTGLLGTGECEFSVIRNVAKGSIGQ